MIETLHVFLETFLGATQFEHRNMFILVNTCLISINSIIIISIIFSMIRFHSKAKKIDAIRVARLLELEQTLKFISEQLKTIEGAIRVCHEYQRKKQCGSD
jgi:hypothetical protein